MKTSKKMVDRARLERAAADLTPVEREVLILTAKQGRWTVDTAEALGLTPREFECHLADAIVKFAGALERQERPWWRFW
jgi:DNA-directed RNA polymerase specialized sigma24 family protein